MVSNRSESPTQSLTIYLLKASVKNFSDALCPNSCSDYVVGPGTLFVQNSYPKPPSWSSYFKKYLDPSQLGKVTTSSAVLLLETKNRIFAITFGHGRHLLLPDLLEDRFGLLVALNSIGENNIRSLDKRTFDAIAKHSKEQASKEAGTRDFGLDIEQDLVRAVTGTPTDLSLGKRMYGMDALNVATNVQLDGLGDLLTKYYNKYTDTSYKKFFPWIDHLAEITKKDTQEQLDCILLNKINNSENERIWMAVPEVVSWEHIGGFRYGMGKSYPEYHDIHLLEFIKSLNDPACINKEILSHKYVYCIDNNGLVLDKWQAYKCLYGEIDHDGDSFLLSGGKWYRVSKDFVDEVNQAYKLIENFTPSLPEYNHDSESHYNTDVANANPKNFALMDCKNISYGGGQSRFEFCDLYSNTRDIIHVKRYGNSSVLSHLFAQGLNSGELFQTDPKFRKSVNDILPDGFKLFDTSTRPPQSDYQVVFAVISNAPGELTLPFFSRLNLKHAARRLEGYGYKVAKAKIGVNSTKSILKKYH